MNFYIFLILRNGKLFLSILRHSARIMYKELGAVGEEKCSSVKEFRGIVQIDEFSDVPERFPQVCYTRLV